MASILPSALTEPSTRALMRRLWREHLRRYRGLLFLTLLLTAITAALTGLYPMVIKHAFDMFGEKDRRILYQLPALVIVLTAAKSAAQYGQTVMIQQIVLLAIRDLQRRMFTHLSKADLARIEREAPAALAARFTTDAAIIREALTKTVNGIADGLTVIGLVGSMLVMDPVLSGAALVLYPLAASPIQKIGKRIRRASGGMQAQMGETASFLNESFAQARVVRAYRLEGLENRRADIAFARLYRSLLSMTMSRARVDPLMEVLGGIAVALVIGVSGWRTAMGHGTIGALPGFISALLLASRPLRALGSLNATMQEGMAGLQRVFQVIDEPAFVVDAPHATALPPGGGLLRFEDVFFDYPDGRPGLQGLNFFAEPGMTVALVGPSGAGKSTALSLIPRLHDVAGGRISVDGIDVRDLQTDSLRDAIAYVGQDPFLFDDTVAANILRGKRGSDQDRVDAAALAASALTFINALPQGMQTPVGPGGQRLSGGQRQRVALARALLRDPRILLLDEATSALDAESEAAVQAALSRLRKGRTTIVVARRLSTVRDADMVVVMDQGKNVEQGTHASLLAADGLYARLVKTQAFAL